MRTAINIFWEFIIHISNRMKLLVLSNGHGEDAIAISIIKELQNITDKLEIQALPIVGTGYAYSKLQIPLVGEVQQMPSGGFIYMGGNPLWEDLKDGLITLTWKQIKTVRQWGTTGGVILAVGDIVPLLFAWMSGCNYAFVGTAKSDYYLRDFQGEWLPKTSWWERKLGSVYLPWERWLMSNQRSLAVFPRDSLTTHILKDSGVRAYDLGNPMMDGFSWSNNSQPVHNFPDNLSPKTISILLLAGSRMPEALCNWQQIVLAVSAVIQEFSHQELLFLAAIAPSLNGKVFQEKLSEQGWQLVTGKHPAKSTSSTGDRIFLQKQTATLCLTQNSYGLCLQQADLAIAMSGTATEQFAGLGKPAVIMPGNGPQCTYAFIEAQTRLLGCSVTLVANPQDVGKVVFSLLNDQQKLQKISDNGKTRMGTPGASRRIALKLRETLLNSPAQSSAI